MQRSNTLSAITPLLRHRTLRVLLLAAPGVTAAVGIITATESDLALAIVFNAAAGILVSSVLFVAVSLAARRLTDERVGLLQAAGQGFWSARAQLLSIHNDETGLYAEWYFRLRLEEEIERSRRYNVHFSILLIKVSGPATDAPDETARAWFGNRVQRHLRVSDLPALLRDGSLAVMLPQTNSDAAQTAQCRLAKELPAAGARSGLASFPGDGENAVELLAAASRAAAGEASDGTGAASSSRASAAA